MKRYEINRELVNTGKYNPGCECTNINTNETSNIDFAWPYLGIQEVNKKPLKKSSSTKGTQTTIANKLINVNPPSPNIFLGT
jgi:hypothetical protein|tara:strand:- start:157 stop:402 length:246 start_codon:yes stop_codon:yes gene_type:complete